MVLAQKIRYLQRLLLISERNTKGRQIIHGKDQQKSDGYHRSTVSSNIGMFNVEYIFNKGTLFTGGIMSISQCGEADSLPALSLNQIKIPT